LAPTNKTETEAPATRGPLTLTVLGCAGSSYDPDLQHPCSSYLLETREAAILLDCGFGSLASFLEHAPGTRLDAIVISHAHGDHTADLNGFLSFASAWRERPHVIASRETWSAIAGQLAAGDVDMFVADGSLVEGSSFRVECSATTHQIATLAVQITMGDVRVVYSADTGPGWLFPPSFLKPDLAILECTLEVRDDESSPYHLDAREVGALAQSLGAIQTIVTHVPPQGNALARLELVRRAAPGREFLLAATGESVVVGSIFEPDLYR
jgi:ribonuclease BN (tRNA processing enzyme)